jgi:hypothetical protein
MLVSARIADLRRAALQRRFVAREGLIARIRRSRPAPAAIGLERAVTIRHAFPDDARALERLAALDSSAVPGGPVLLCEVDGELSAALSLADGGVLADPFRPTVALVQLLRARARQLHAAAPAPGRQRISQRYQRDTSFAPEA